jgi:outer membrane lipoprotein-sorting protein
MDAFEALQNVARTYAGLKTLSVDVVSVTEIEDEGSSTRTAERTKAWFEAPNKVRMEKRGRQGTLLVSDGIVTYHLGVCLP